MNKIKLIGIYGITLSLLIFGCKISDFSNNNSTEQTDDKIWVYLEIKKILPRDTSDFYFYGQINKTIVDKINKNPKIDGLFILSDIRYWNDDDLLQVYEDNKDNGYKIFRISDIQYLTSYKTDPIFNIELNQLHESAKKIRNENMPQQNISNIK